jgi:nucleoside-diphosphate-sugar epimerase
MIKKILITGATGFVGSQVLSSLNDKNVNLRAVVRKSKDNFLAEKNDKVEIIIIEDLFNKDVAWWKNNCKGISTVIHVAWSFEHGNYLQSLKNIDCMIGTLNLAKGAMLAGVKKFVGIGTCFEYDMNYRKLSVNTPLKPLTVYAGAKASLYTILSQFFSANSVKFIWCRLFYLYGINEKENRLVAYLHKKLSNGQNAYLTSGKQIRDFLDVSEVGRIIAKIALGNQEGPINICSGKPISIRQLAENIADKYGRRDLLKFNSRPDNLFDPPYILGVPNYENKN